MVRLIATADWHLGLSRYSPPSDPLMRLRDFEAAAHRFVDAAIEHKVDLAVVAGDTFHTRAPRPPELAAAARIFRRLSDAGIPTEVTTGNHDGPATVGDAGSHTLSWLEAVALPGINVRLTPGTHEVAGASVTTLPYPHRRSFDQLRPDLAPEARMEEIGRFLSDTIEGMAQGDLPRIFIGHMSVAGSALGAEATMRFGWDTVVSADAFAPFDIAVLGHIHVAQQIGNAFYCGSPERVDFTEAALDKGFLLAEVERGKPPKVERIDSHPRPMVLLDHPDGDTADVAEGAIVRVLLGPGQRIDVNGAGYTEYRFDQPERPVTEGARAIDADLDWEAALRHWLTLNGHEPEPALSAAKDLIAGA